VRITALDADGHGVGHVGGVAVSVPGTLPGETVDVTLSASRRGIALLTRVVVASPHRVTPRCRHAAECGGCTWQHLAYGEQLRLKRERVQFLLDEALGRGVARVRPAVPTPAAAEGGAPWHFRHKVHFAFDEDAAGRVVMGHLRRGSRRVVDVTECPVHAEAGNALAWAVRAAVARAGVPCGPPPAGVVRHLVLRVARAVPEVVGTLVATRPDDRLKRVSREVLAAGRPPDGWHLNLHPLPGALLFGRETRLVSGRERLREGVGGATFLMSPTAFFQTNVAAAERLLERVVDAAGPPGGRTLDLYAGLGLFAIPLAIRGHEVVAVEESPRAVEDGLLSATANGLDPSRCRFVRTKVEYAIARVARGPRRVDLVVLDPPRTGANVGALRAIRDRVAPARIVYVSCDPEALARDLRELGAAARDRRYRVVSVTPVDMFPHTAHVETVTLLERA
jgi:23S rRNA (uracil-5-)-methyltransferase RumA